MMSKEYQSQYEKTRLKSITIKLNRNTDADVIAYLETVPNVRALLIELLRWDMELHDFVVQKEEGNGE